MKKLLVPQINPASFRRNVWRVTPPQGTTLEDVLNKDFWSHVTKRLKLGDLLEVLPEGNEWYAVLFVLAVDKTSATVKVLNEYQLVDAAPAVTKEVAKAAGDEPYYIKFRGPKNQWCVLRTSDNEVLKEGMTKDEAAAEAENLKLAA